jgi:hypothetical protein
MAMTDNSNTPLWSRRHFHIRLAGLAGILIGGAGIALAAAGSLWLGLALGVIGGAAALAALVVEFQSASHFAGGRRASAGAAVALQVLLAAFLLAEVNIFSFYHYHRFDWTRDREFSLRADIRHDLAKLRGKTVIVVHLSHNFGQISDKRDEYDHAAERVVIDKVEDIAEQFREFGPQFRVLVLDKKDKRYRDKLKSLAEVSSALPKAIRATAEDSVFVFANNKVQRLGFQEIFQLDKKQSQEANGGRGNLVLHYQGVGPFARRILNVDERRPRVAVGVVHEYLSTESDIDRYTMAGARKALQDHGFDCEDILLKKGLDTGNPQPIVMTFDENKYEKLEGEITQIDLGIKRLRDELRQLNRILQRWRKASLKDLTKEYGEQLQLKERGVKEVTEEIRQSVINRNLIPQIALLRMELDSTQNDRRATRDEQQKLNITGLAEQRRIKDLKAKLARKLANCDLLVLPRMTLRNVANQRENLPAFIYKLDPVQVAAIKDFLRKGKPVLALFGPNNWPGGMPLDVMHGGADGMELLLGELGIRLGNNETILFNSELKSFAERNIGFLLGGTRVEIPPVDFEWKPGGRPGISAGLSRGDRKENPIAVSMLLTLAGLDEKQDELRLRHPRPVYYERGFGNQHPGTDPVFLMSDPRGWKEAQPFPSEGKVPRPNLQDSGQYPIGVAVETTLPPYWKPEQDHVRVAAIGQGGVFVGNQLSPVREKLLLDTCNWLLGRDDMLAHKKARWEYPRVGLTAQANELWQWGTRLGIPAFFVVLGIAVLLKRGMR